MVLPEHMDRWTRTAWLFDTLKGMGLFVSPIPESDDPTKINRLVVSVGLPWETGAEQPAEAGIHGAVQGPQVGNVVGAAEDGCDNVVNFPAVR
jgi:hypothetical protein